jgi:hypothetical protein
MDRLSGAAGLFHPVIAAMLGQFMFCTFFANAASRRSLDKRNLDGDLDESDAPEHMRKISRLSRVPQVGNGVVALNAIGPAR